jgi:hypothetical protein
MQWLSVLWVHVNSYLSRVGGWPGSVCVTSVWMFNVISIEKELYLQI